MIGSSTCIDPCESTTLEDKTLVDQTVYLDNGSAHIYNTFGVFTDTEGQSQLDDSYCGLRSYSFSNSGGIFKLHCNFHQSSSFPLCQGLITKWREYQSYMKNQM